ncbi:MAG: hypothetical protein ACRC7N_07395 [Clostridium sp.]
MSIQIIKMVIGISGIIILGVLLIKELLKPVIDNKLAVLTLGREKGIVDNATSSSKSVRHNTGRGFSTKSKSNSEFINDTTVEESDDTELLNDETELIDGNPFIDLAGTELLKNSEIVESQDDDIYDYTDLINNSK